MSHPGFLSLALSKQVAGKAIKVALFVGTLLALINHGGKVLSFSLTSQEVIKVLLCYLVPYGVSTWSAVAAIRGSSTNKK